MIHEAQRAVAKIMARRACPHTSWLPSLRQSLARWCGGMVAARKAVTILKMEAHNRKCKHKLEGSENENELSIESSVSYKAMCMRITSGIE